MDKDHLKSLLYRILASALVITSFAGFRFWQEYEEKKLRDVERMSSVIQMQSLLNRFYQDRSVYPPSSKGALVIGEQRSDCLGTNGFASIGDVGCGIKPYSVEPLSRFALLPAEQMMYRGTMQDDSECRSEVGCPAYQIPTLFETRNFVPKPGNYTITPQGIRP